MASNEGAESGVDVVLFVRRFEDSAGPGEARADFEEVTGRDTAMGDGAEDTTRQDLLDLNSP